MSADSLSERKEKLLSRHLFLHWYTIVLDKRVIRDPPDNGVIRFVAVLTHMISNIKKIKLEGVSYCRIQRVYYLFPQSHYTRNYKEKRHWLPT